MTTALLDFVAEQTADYLAAIPKAQRKQYGQFFTSKETALFMANLFLVNPDQNKVSVLDPGAGSGMLATALLERLVSEPSIQEIELVCYENDDNVIPLLQSNLNWVCAHAGKKVSAQIINDNYILSQEQEYNGMLGASAQPKSFDFIIGNPPYMKVSKDAPEALAMPDVCYGAPNMYFLFASMSLFNLKAHGEMVYIIPRSWTSGAYFKSFRQKFLTQGELHHLHLFISRDKVFSAESVLQETMILKVAKAQLARDQQSANTARTITITTSNSNSDFAHQTTFEAPYDVVVSGEERYVYLVTNQEEVDSLTRVQSLQNTLPSLGLKMKTGLTVGFRNKEYLRDHAEQHAVPLFYAQHIKQGLVEFPLGKEQEYLVTDHHGLLQQNTNYLFVKRFTAKEEPRRLQCGIYLSRMHPEYKEISTDNKINFIAGLHSLSESLIYGLYVLFNSSLYDCYYRLLNGSTQVNASEINTMPVPSLQAIESMGNDLLRQQDLSASACDQILRGYV